MITRSNSSKTHSCLFLVAVPSGWTYFEIPISQQSLMQGKFPDKHCNSIDWLRKSLVPECQFDACEYCAISEEIM